MKAIYSVLNNKIYRINQDTSEPRTLTTMPGNERSVVSADTVLKKVTASVFLSTMETENVKSNKELYNCMKHTIERQQITEIKTIYNRYSVLIDYQLFNSTCEICHNIVVKPIEARDAVILLGVAANNELVYRRVKLFDPIVEFATANQLPLGIMKTADSEYHFKINDISIYQDTSSTPNCCHNSIYCTPYNVNACSTVTDSLSDYICIYSSAAQGIQISDVDINFVPKTIDLKINFSLASLIVAYDDSDIIALIQKVIIDKYHPVHPPVPDTGGDDSGILFPGKDHKPADGSIRPNKDGWYDYYEKCQETNPGALLVVEDLIPDTAYDVKTMIKKRLVVLDIPDIQVGDYVRYVEALDEDHRHHHHHHHHHPDVPPCPPPPYPPCPPHPEPTPEEGNEEEDDNPDDVFDDVDGDDSSDLNVGDMLHNIPSARDRGATLDNTNTASNIHTNMNGFTMMDLNDILI